MFWYFFSLNLCSTYAFGGWRNILTHGHLGWWNFLTSCTLIHFTITNMSHIFKSCLMFLCLLTSVDSVQSKFRIPPFFQPIQFYSSPSWNLTKSSTQWCPSAPSPSTSFLLALLTTTHLTPRLPSYPSYHSLRLKQSMQTSMHFPSTLFTQSRLPNLICPISFALSLTITTHYSRCLILPVVGPMIAFARGHVTPHWWAPWFIDGHSAERVLSSVPTSVSCPSTFLPHPRPWA